MEQFYLDFLEVLQKNFRNLDALIEDFKKHHPSKSECKPFIYKEGEDTMKEFRDEVHKCTCKTEMNCEDDCANGGDYDIDSKSEEESKVKPIINKVSQWLDSLTKEDIEALKKEALQTYSLHNMMHDMKTRNLKKGNEEYSKNFDEGLQSMEEEYPWVKCMEDLLSGKSLDIDSMDDECFIEVINRLWDEGNVSITVNDGRLSVRKIK